MNLLKKTGILLKKIILIGSIPIILGGCSTTGSWESVKTDWKYVNSEKEDERLVNRECLRFLEHNIGEISNNEIPIKKSLEEKVYYTKEETTRKNFEEIAVQERETSYGLSTGIVGGLGGALLGALLLSPVEGSESSDIEPGTIGSFLGALGGFRLGWEIGSNSGTTETRKVNTGKKAFKFDEDQEKILYSWKSIYENKPSENLDVTLSARGNKWDLKTNNYGKIPLSDISKKLESLNPTYFFDISSKQDFFDHIDKIPYLREMRPETKDEFKETMFQSHRRFPETKIPFSLSTEGEVINVEVKNDKRNFTCLGRYLSDNLTMNFIKDLIDERVNSKINTLELAVKDSESHVNIDGSRIEIKSDAPSKSELAGQYFRGDLKNFAIDQIDDYLRGRETFTYNSIEETLPFRVYRSGIELKIVHPDYNFVEGKFEVRKDTKKTAYMVEKGKKIRVEESEESKGIIK